MIQITMALPGKCLITKDRALEMRQLNRQRGSHFLTDLQIFKLGGDFPAGYLS